MHLADDRHRILHSIGKIIHPIKDSIKSLSHSICIMSSTMRLRVYRSQNKENDMY